MLYHVHIWKSLRESGALGRRAVAMWVLSTEKFSITHIHRWTCLMLWNFSTLSLLCRARKNYAEKWLMLVYAHIRYELLYELNDIDFPFINISFLLTKKMHIWNSSQFGWFIFSVLTWKNSSEEHFSLSLSLSICFFLNSHETVL